MPSGSDRAAWLIGDLSSESAPTTRPADSTGDLSVRPSSISRPDAEAMGSWPGASADSRPAGGLGLSASSAPASREGSSTAFGPSGNEGLLGVQASPAGAWGAPLAGWTDALAGRGRDIGRLAQSVPVADHPGQALLGEMGGIVTAAGGTPGPTPSPATDLVSWAASPSPAGAVAADGGPVVPFGPGGAGQVAPRGAGGDGNLKVSRSAGPGDQAVLAPANGPNAASVTVPESPGTPATALVPAAPATAIAPLGRGVEGPIGPDAPGAASRGVPLGIGVDGEPRLAAAGNLSRSRSSPSPSPPSPEADAPGEGPSASDPATGATAAIGAGGGAEIPEPQGAGLITKFWPFAHSAMEQAIDQVLGEYEGLGASMAAGSWSNRLALASLTVTVAGLTWYAAGRKASRDDEPVAGPGSSPVLFPGLPRLRRQPQP